MIGFSSWVWLCLYCYQLLKNLSVTLCNGNGCGHTVCDCITYGWFQLITYSNWEVLHTVWIILHTQFMSLCVCCLCRCSCDFWSVQCPSVPCTYTLTLSAPQEEDWWGSHAPSMEGTTVEAPDLGCPCVTVGELTTTWDTLRHRER